MTRIAIVMGNAFGVAAIAALIAACAAKGSVVGDAPAECYQVQEGVTLVPPSTGVEWLCANPDTDPTCWDDLGKRVVPALVAKLLATERSRQTCAGFIQDLKHQGVLKR